MLLTARFSSSAAATEDPSVGTGGEIALVKPSHGSGVALAGSFGTTLPSAAINAAHATNVPIPLPGKDAPAPAIAQPGASTGALSGPTTVITSSCNVLSECVGKAEELLHQIKILDANPEMAAQHQAASGSSADGGGAAPMGKEAIQNFLVELKTTASAEISTMVHNMRASPTLIHQAGMHELRRALYYSVSLKRKDWLSPDTFNASMKMLSLEFLRRDYDGALSSDDVLFISTHVIMSNYYNRHLWNRMEQALYKFKTFDHVDMNTIRGLSTKLSRSRKDAQPEALDVRRKVLHAMSRRVGVLVNDFEIPTIIGILNCYSKHDMMPKHIETLALRAINHIGDLTPYECAQLVSILRRWGMMRLEVCERLIERICTVDELSVSMATGGLLAVRTCFARISEGGRNAVNAEPTKQKLRSIGEQLACRLDEVKFQNLQAILACLDVVVTIRVYVPRKCLQNLFSQANEMIGMAMEGKQQLNFHGQPRRPITAEEGRQLQATLYHYGQDLSPELSSRLRQAFKDGLLPDEASI